MTTEAAREAWMESGEYLPEPMRDFHNQKDIFKAIHQAYALHDNADSPSWVQAHIYTVDNFLWYMARCGYTLQRSRKKLPFRDLDDDVAVARDQRVYAMADMIEGKP